MLFLINLLLYVNEFGITIWKDSLKHTYNLIKFELIEQFKKRILFILKCVKGASGKWG